MVALSKPGGSGTPDIGQVGCIVVMADKVLNEPASFGSTITSPWFNYHHESRTKTSSGRKGRCSKTLFKTKQEDGPTKKRNFTVNSPNL